MTSKFAGFEGIDLESKEVFETSDTEASFEIADHNEARRDSIEEPDLNIEQSRSRFETNMIDAHLTDFSGRIDRLASYETYTVKETRQNKVKRLFLELQELEEEIEHDDDSTEDLVKLKELFYKINRKTKDLKITKLEDIKPESIDSKDQSPNPSLTTSIDSKEFQEIESKISAIEKTIGVNFKPDSSIQSTINDLFRKFKLISNNEEELSKINESIDEINTKFEKSILNRRSDAIKKDIDDDSKISEIYKQFQNFVGYEEEIPLIIKRLEALNDLHLRAADSLNTVEDLDSSINGLKQDFDKWDASLSMLEVKLDGLNDCFEKARTSSK